MEQDIRLQIQTDLLTCPLCRRPYVKPRTLPCHHTFCETCVARCAGNYLTFPCPSCRRDAAVPVSGVPGFPEDVFLSRLSFKIRTIEEPYVTPFVINECLTHQRQAIRFYCQTCERPLCRECPRGNHNSHKVCHIEEQIERMKERVGTALSDQRQRSATAVTSLQAVRDSITEILPQKQAMERHIEALVHERIQAVFLEGEALQKELDSLCDSHLSDMTEKKKDLESTVETLLTFDVEAERELARGGLVDVNRHGEISEKLKIMYEAMNRPLKKTQGLQATFVPITIASDRLVGYFEGGGRPVHGINRPESTTQSSRVVAHMKEQTFQFGSFSQNGHDTGSSVKDDWEKVELRTKAGSQHAGGIRAGTFGGVTNRPASARYSDEKAAEGSWAPDRRFNRFSLRETQSENAKSVPYMRRQVSEPVSPTHQSYTTRGHTQQSEPAQRSTHQSGPAIRSTQPYVDTRTAQQSDTVTMPTQQSRAATRPTQQSTTAHGSTQQPETATKLTSLSGASASNQTSMRRQMSESARSTVQPYITNGATQESNIAPLQQSERADRPTQVSGTAHRSTQEAETAHGPTQQSETAYRPTEQSETAHRPSQQSETVHGPTEQSQTAHRPTQPSETAHMHTQQSGTAHRPTEQSETAYRPTEQLEIAYRPTEQSETAHRPTQQSETAHRPPQLSDTATRSTEPLETAREHTHKSDTANRRPAQQSETARGPTLQSDDQNFVRWKTIRITSKEKVSKVLEFPSHEDSSEEIFL
ncbi:hypothetical protein Bbelb_266700 [Branchiostoma belcheri]|nr:hypothetical protein Bbelb_266700 [Branchiostoma belcheri]